MTPPGPLVGDRGTGYDNPTETGVLVPDFDLSALAAGLAARLNRSDPGYTFSVVEETVRVVGRREAPEGATRLDLEFDGLVDCQGEPLTYTARASVLIDADGRPLWETLTF